MITYIAESQYEEAYNKWEKEQKDLDPVDMAYYIEREIQSHAKGMATNIAYGNKIQSNFWKDIVASARFWMLSSKFQNKFIIGPSGGDRNAIPVDPSILRYIKAK